MVQAAFRDTATIRWSLWAGKTLRLIPNSGYSYDRTNVITKGGWDKMPGEAQGNFAVARACADGLEVLMKK
jgi:hypothetical protein